VPNDLEDDMTQQALRRSRSTALLNPLRVPQVIAERRSRVERRRHRRRVYAQLLLAVDALALLLAGAASVFGAVHGGAAPESVGFVLLYTALTMLLIAGRGGYRLRLETSALEKLSTVVAATATSAILLIAARVVLDPATASAPQAVRLWAFATVYLVGARMAATVVAARASRPGLPTLVIGAGEVGQTVARRLLERPEMGLTPVGFLDKEPREDEGAEIPVLGASWDLERVVTERHVEHVIVTFSTAPHSVLLTLVRRCRALGVEVSLVPRLFEEISTRASIQHLGGIALLNVDQADPRGWQIEIKYFLDRLAAALVLLLLAPALLIVALLVRITSPGPILFRQPRVGLDGQEFNILKFRTMQVAPAGVENDAAWAARTLGGSAEEPADEGADRRTPIGRFLRRWSLDELPQFLNIVRGEMSFIGPRPERTGYVRAFEEHVYRYGDRHRVKSGLTGWAQVQGLRGDTSLRDRVEWDNYYVENWSPWLDLKILILTIPAVFGGRGAE